MIKNKKILGLDIGTTSIGWAIVEAKTEKPIKEQTKNYEARETNTDINNDRTGIHIKDGKAAVGVRIIKQDTDSIQQFNLGKKLNDGTKATPTAKRRQKRGSRRLKSRYKLRRQKLHQILDLLGMLPAGITKNEIIDKKGKTIVTFTQDKNSKYYTAQKGKRENDDIGKTIYELRDKAIRDGILLPEYGRILLHLNQWRGYSSDRFSVEEKQTFDYYTGEIITLDIENKIPAYNKDNKDKLKPDSFKVAIKIKLFEAINISDDSENPNWVNEFDGFIFKKEFNINIGEIITIKEPEWKQVKNGKKIIDEYYEIRQTFPKPEDWGFRYQTLQKNLTDYCKDGVTVGSYFYQNFYINKTIERIRTNIVNRDWYEKEFDKIFKLQYEKHKEHFQSFKIEQIVATTFKPTYKDGSVNPAYQQILNEVEKNAKENSAKSGNGIEFEQLKYLIKNVIIYYQRPWQQAKNKGECKFEKILVKVEKKNKITGALEKTEEYRGRTVIPRSHPLHQEFKIWNQINNVKLFFVNHDVRLELLKADVNECEGLTGYTAEDIKNKLYDELSTHGEVNYRTFIEDLLKETKISVIVLGIGKNKKTEEKDLPDLFFTINYTKRNRKTGEVQDDKLKGNKTFYQIHKIVGKDKDWYNNTWKASNDNHKAGTKLNVDKGEFKNCEYTTTNLQLLWETIYDISIIKKEKVAELLQKHFTDFTPEQCNQISTIKFDDGGMAQLSAKAIRNLLPLMNNSIGYTHKAEKQIASLLKVNEDEKDFENESKLLSVKDFFKDAKTRLELAKKTTKDSYKYLSYTEATAVIYGSHSSKGIQGNFKAIETVRQHSMNNPIVEKIVNETIRVVNDIYETYGFDEVRIELSRELKASADEREQMSDIRDKNTQKNEWAKEMLRELFNALKNDNRDVTKLDTYSGGSNIDKIKIMDDIANEHYNSLLKAKTELTDKQKQPTKSEIEKYLLWVEQMHRCPYTNEVIPLTDVFHKDKIVQIEHIIPRERFPNNSYSNKVITWSTVNADKADFGNRTAYEYIVHKRNSSKTSVDLPKSSAKYSEAKKTVDLVNADNWLNHIELLFPKGAKRNNLLRKEIPQEPLERELKDTQYINKKLKEKLAEIVGSDKVHSTTGQVTDILRESWHLNDVMKDITKERFENFKITKLKPEFEISAAQLQNQLEAIEELLESETKEFKIIKSAEVSINIEGKELINDIKNKLDSFITNTKKITKNTTFQIALNEKVYEVTGEELIEEARVILKESVEKNEAVCKIILQHQDSFVTKDTDEIQAVKEELEERINTNDEEGKAKEFKYYRSAKVNLITENKENQKHKEQYNGYSKRIDHRHHALDAIIIACTKQNHIQYLNNMNTINSADQGSDAEKSEKYKALKEDVCRKSEEGHLQANKFNYPWEDYNKTHISNPLEEIIIVNKNTNILISPSKNKNIKDVTKQNAISIRGNLHKETIYGKRKFVDLSEKGKVKISALVTKILKQKAEAQNKLEFKTIIDDLIFQRKYQTVMYGLMEKYNDIKLCLKDISNDDLVPINEVSKEINKALKINNPFVNKKGEKLTWLRVYQLKDKAVRPNGLTMNFNKVKDGIKNIADPRIYKTANYRLDFVNQKIKDIENSSFSSTEKEIEKNKILQLPLYSNAIYDVKVRNQNGTSEWIEIKNLKGEDLDKIDFGNGDKNTKVKAKINERGLDNLKKDYFTNPIYISSKLIPVKKTREKAFYQDLVEIKPKQFVYSADSYLFLVLKGQPKKEIVPLKFLDVIQKIDRNRHKINVIEVAKKSGINIDKIEFTLQTGDIVYLPNENLEVPFDIEKIDWTNLKAIIPNLFVVKDMNPSQNKIVFAKINTASAIELNKKDVSNIFKGSYSKDFTEEIKYGTVGMLQTCIKVYTNRLGTKVIPYTKFENGIWNKEDAILNGLLKND